LFALAGASSDSGPAGWSGERSTRKEASHGVQNGFGVRHPDGLPILVGRPGSVLAQPSEAQILDALRSSEAPPQTDESCGRSKAEPR
jgi:hypothetical protein